VKSPSKEELVRVVLTKLLKGEALVACENMKTLEEILKHLKGTYGNAKLLINRLLDDIRKMGYCKGDELKMRTWTMNMKSKLMYVQSLAKDHTLEKELYHSQIAVEVQTRFPIRAQEDFHLILEDIDKGNEVPQERVFTELLLFLEKLVKRFNFRLNLGTRVNEVEVGGGKFGGEMVRRQPAAKPAPRRAYNVEQQLGGGGGYGGYDGGGGYGGDTGYPDYGGYQDYGGDPRNGYDIRRGGGEGYGGYGGYGGGGYGNDGGGRGMYNMSSKLANCALCSNKHTHLYYCSNFQRANAEDRWGLARKAGVCFRCLILAADVDFDDRKGWFERHKAVCDTEWACRAGKCELKPKARQISFLLCAWHSRKNLDMEAKFMKTLDPNQFQGPAPTKFLFNVPLHLFNWNYTSAPAQPTEGWVTLPDVDAPAIFMLAYLLIDEKKFLCFFDSGCMSASISQKVKDLLKTETVRPGPSDISVASGTTLRIPGGEERFSIPLADGVTRCTITALCMPTVTTPFPVWDTQEAVDDITTKYKEFHPNGDDLPAVPKLIGGCAIDIMLGAKYTRWFPQLKFMADCGLSIHQSLLLAPEGEKGVLIGPHRSWRRMHASHMIMRVYSAVPVDRPEHIPEESRVQEVVEVHGDVFDGGGLGEEAGAIVNCEGAHCIEHEGDDWRKLLVMQTGG
jgi:hypothetical protein